MITEHVVAIDFIESEEVQDNRRAAYSELEDLVERGVELPCELLFSKFPNMAANRDWVLELIYLEYVLRRERGQSPTLADFQRRFPNLQRDIEMLIEVDSVIGVTEPIDSNSTQGKLDESIHLRSASIAKSVSRQLGRVGDYELQEVIGRGGMGIVYRGTQPRLGRAVAVKTIDAMASLDASVVRRFLAEATLAARLQHPNIVPIYEVGSHADIPFFSMELVTGGTLATNPASSVRGPRYQIKKGKTPILCVEEMRRFLEKMKTSSVIGLRDRALIALMVYSFGRVSAVLKMRVKDYFPKGKRKSGDTDKGTSRCWRSMAFAQIR